MFLTTVNEREIIDSVAKFTKKTSDCVGIDMTIAKRVIEGDFKTFNTCLQLVIPNWHISKQNEKSKNHSSV